MRVPEKRSRLCEESTLKHPLLNCPGYAFDERLKRGVGVLLGLKNFRVFFEDWTLLKSRL